MTGERDRGCGDRLRAESGVLDVSVGTRHGKKGARSRNSGFSQDRGDGALAQACFTETSTLGLRLARERPPPAASNRSRLRRSTAADVSVKIALRPGGKTDGEGRARRRRWRRGALSARRERRSEAVKSVLKDSGE
jgi:hypothetical protein